MTTRTVQVNVSFFLALVMSAAMPGTASEGSFLDEITWFGKKTVDPSIPENYQRSFKTSRNDIVMVFEGSRWRSLTDRAVTGASSDQHSFCVALTKSDRKQGLIPSGFEYAAGGDGHIYLLKTQQTPVEASDPGPVLQTASPVKASPSQPAVSVKKKARVPEKKPSVPHTVASAPETARHPAASASKSLRQEGMQKGSYRTTLGNVMMIPQGGHWEGRAPKDKRGGLAAPEFCGQAAARDRLSGRLPYDHTYVLLADDTLVAVPRTSQLARVAQAR